MVTKKVNLRIWEDNYVALHTEKGEVDSRYIEVSFKDENLNNLNLTGKSVTFYAQKPDQTQIFSVCTVNTTTNTATVKLTSEALNMSGVLICEFQIFDSNNVLLKVGGLRIIVASDVDFGEALESSSSADIVTVIMNSIGDLSSLTTTAKSSAVAAINELNAKVIPISQGGTGATAATGARTNLEVFKEYSLYSNESGTNGTVPLSDSAAGYDKLTIYYRHNDGEYLSMDIYEPNDKNSLLFSVKFKENNNTYLSSAKIGISGTSITWTGDHGYNRLQTSPSITATNGFYLSIIKVVGYKY